MSTYRLARDGDDVECHYWGLFIKDQFPSYEKLWLKFVVPLTNRPDNIHFKTDAELAKINKSKSDLCIAQLNYSIIRHLVRCFDVLSAIKNSSDIKEQFDLLLEGMTRLVGVQDNAFELLERLKNPNRYRPFLEKDGKNAREKWQKDHDHPLQTIRDYRNSLVHGRLPPGIVDGQRLCLPDVGKVDSYLDWRKVTQKSDKREEYKKDFISVYEILSRAWSETINYLENEWKDLPTNHSYKAQAIKESVQPKERG